MISLNVAKTLLAKQFGEGCVVSDDESVGVAIIPEGVDRFTFSLMVYPSLELEGAVVRAVSWARMPTPLEHSPVLSSTVTQYLNQLQRQGPGRWTFTAEGRMACDIVLFSNRREDLEHVIGVVSAIMAINIADLIMMFGMELPNPNEENEPTGLA
jgi:hypothetical protein